MNPVLCAGFFLPSFRFFACYASSWQTGRFLWHHEDSGGNCMNTAVLTGLLLPFAGTVLGSACVYLMKNNLKPLVQRSLSGFAAGVMVAASIWSLLVPAMDQSADLGRWAFLPAFLGFWAGILFLLLLDHTVPHLHLDTDVPEGPPSTLKKTSMMVLAVTLHNIPEGMAVGVVLAGWLAGTADLTMASVMALSIGIAIQNFPEGAIVSMPLKATGMSRNRAFVYGTLSGVVEPIAAGLTLLASSLVTPLLPGLLSFAAGAMIYVVVEELIPEASSGEHSNLGILSFALGFSLMMALDVALG